MSLIRSAKANFLVYLIDYLGVTAVSIVLNPVLSRYLGMEHFGIWKLIQRVMEWAAISDGKTGQTLKWTLCSLKNNSEKKRDQVSNCVVSWFHFLPLLFFVGLVIIIGFPYAMHGVSVPDKSLIRFVFALMFVNVLLTQCYFLPEAILIGENKGYKLLTVTTLSSISLLVTSYPMLIMGWGIMGMAIANIVVSIIHGIYSFRLLKINIAWFKFGMIIERSKDFKEYFKRTYLIALSTIIEQSMRLADIFVLGFVAGPLIIGKFSIYSFYVQFIIQCCSMIVSAIAPGLGSMLSSANTDKIKSLKDEINIILLFVATILGAIVLSFGHSMTQIWMGTEFRISSSELLVIIIASQIFALSKIDSSIIELALPLKSKLIRGITSLVLFCLLTWAGSFLIDSELICVEGAFGLSRLYYSIHNRYFVEKVLKIQTQFNVNIIRKYLVGGGVLLCAYYISTILLTDNLIYLLLMGLLTFVLSTLIMFYLSLSKSERVLISNRFLSAIYKREG